MIEPICPTDQPFSMWTMDHLRGYANKLNLTQYKPERGLKDVKITLFNYFVLCIIYTMQT